MKVCHEEALGDPVPRPGEAAVSPWEAAGAFGLAPGAVACTGLSPGPEG